MMSPDDKATHLRSAHLHLDQTTEHLATLADQLTHSIHDLRLAVQKPSLDFVAQRKLLALLEERLEQVSELRSSPYFHRCDVQFDHDKPTESFYISKFSVPEQHLVSWVAPAARLRFETPGPCQYPLPDGTYRNGTLFRKDQYLIVDKHILFFAMDRWQQERELIYQQHFTQHKTDFVLPEIVAQMEKAQDEVLRIPHQGSLLISGPAGSGKTTLALHRIAFLAQSPDTSPLFPHRRMIVFVQDPSTQAYFSHLLPTLGIHHVRITTFDTWAMDHLSLNGYTYQFRIGSTEDERDRYEEEKNQLLRSLAVRSPDWFHDPIRLLDRFYRLHLPAALQSVWEWQKQHHHLDRFDLTILLACQQQREGSLTVTRVRRIRQKNGVWKEKRIREGYHYALMLLDEIQNYLPLQVQLLKSCIDPTTNALMYVGDLSQQTRIGSLKHWEEINESFTKDRAVVLQKGYRQTEQLMRYLQTRGYAVTIPPHAKQGPAVEEHIALSSNEKRDIIHASLRSHPTERLVGILAFSPEELLPYRSSFHEHPHIRCMTIHEAQGVEFDTVYLLEQNASASSSHQASPEIMQQRSKIHHDLLYVALTRAMYELHVFRDEG